MNRIEEVKKILAKALFSCESQGDYKVCLPHINNIEIIADLINQLYEPQPDQSTICPNCKGRKWVGYEGGFGDDCPMCKGKGKLPDQSSRLLSDVKIQEIQLRFVRFKGDKTDVGEGRALAEAQRDLTASIKDAEWR